jgi:hypothetical protein
MSVARPLLVMWVYSSDSGESYGFSERVLATPDEEERLHERLSKSVDADLIYDLYIGPEQATPTPFEEFWQNLDANPALYDEEEPDDPQAP